MATKYSEVDLNTMATKDVAKLRGIAKELGVSTAGVKPSEIAKAILKKQGGVAPKAAPAAATPAPAAKPATAAVPPKPGPVGAKPAAATPAPATSGVKVAAKPDTTAAATNEAIIDIQNRLNSVEGALAEILSRLTFLEGQVKTQLTPEILAELDLVHLQKAYRDLTGEEPPAEANEDQLREALAPYTEAVTEDGMSTAGPDGGEVAEEPAEYDYGGQGIHATLEGKENLDFTTIDALPFQCVIYAPDASVETPTKGAITNMADEQGEAFIDTDEGSSLKGHQLVQVKVDGVEEELMVADVNIWPLSVLPAPAKKPAVVAKKPAVPTKK